MSIDMNSQIEQADHSFRREEGTGGGEPPPRIAQETKIEDLVSVVMPLHNKETLLAESIESIICQTYEKWELIIIDDASSDGSLEIAVRFSRLDPRIRIISLATNAGVAKARNAGIAQCRGRYLAFLDSDDIWLPEKLRVQLAFMKQHAAAISFTQFRRFTADGWLSPPVGVPAQVSYDDLLKGNVIGCLTVMVDRYAVGDFSMPSVRHEDYVAWLAILKKGHLALGVPEDLAKYRISRLSISGDKARSAAWTWRVYREIERLSILKSLWCFACYFGRATMIRVFDWEEIG